MKKALILNGSENEIPLIESAKRHGYHVITTGDNPSLIGHSYADEYAFADYSDKEQILKLAKQLNVDIIIPCANDFSVISAAYAAEKLGLGGHDSYESALVLHEKSRFKAFGKANGLSIIPSESFCDIDSALEYIKLQTGYPLMIKPTDLSGGKGITKVFCYEEAESALKIAFERTKRNTVVVEPFIEGPNFAYEALIVNHKVVIDLCLNDCFYKNPFLVSHSFGHFKPLANDIMPFLKSEVEKIAEILDLHDGMWCLQFVLSSGKPYYIETMRRCLGNFPIMANSNTTEYNWYDFMIKAYSSCPIGEYGLPKSFSREDKYSGYVCYMADKNGVMKKMWADPEFEKHFIFKLILASPGRIIKDYLNEKLGYAVYSFDTFEEMYSYTSHIYDFVHVEVEEQ